MKEFYTQKEAIEIFKKVGVKVGRKALTTLVRKGTIIKAGSKYSRASIEAYLGFPIEGKGVESPKTGEPTGIELLKAETAQIVANTANKEAKLKALDIEARQREADEIIEKATERAEKIETEAKKMAVKRVHAVNELKIEWRDRGKEVRTEQKAVADREAKVNLATDKIEGQLELLTERAKAVQEGESRLSTQKSQFKAERASSQAREYVAPRPQASTPQEPEKHSLLPENWRTWVFGGVVALVVIWWLIAEATCSKGG